MRCNSAHARKFYAWLLVPSMLLWGANGFWGALLPHMEAAAKPGETPRVTVGDDAEATFLSAERTGRRMAGAKEKEDSQFARPLEPIGQRHLSLLREQLAPRPATPASASLQAANVRIQV